MAPYKKAGFPASMNSGECLGTRMIQTKRFLHIVHILYIMQNMQITLTLSKIQWHLLRMLARLL